MAVKARRATFGAPMAPTFSRIGLTGKPGDAAVRAVLARLAAFAHTRGIEIFVDAGVGAGLDAPELAPAALAERADLIICVGGDGSLLHAARQYGLAGLPLLGVNLGRLGFLVDVSPAELEQRLDELVGGRFAEEQRLLLDMVAILYPTLDALVLVPISPHTLSDRPLVVGADSRIALTVGDGGGARVSCDGQRGFTLETGDTVTVTRSTQAVRLLHPPDYDYFRILRDKLHWGRAPGPTE
ncbi:MAG: NAD(+)/NADH kinase [Xanthomonadaceae bacterium]|nr:NAD(+)/NADH kinase [Xanthomonadaceae bacterium]